jgi:hypothetical protein
MAPPTTVRQFAQEERARREAAHTAAQAELGAAQTALVSARSALAARTAELAGLDAQLASIRGALGTVPMPADATALAADLEQAIMDERAKSAEVGDAEDAAAAAQRRVDAAQAELATVSATYALALTAETEAETEDERRQESVTALGETPLADLDAQATAAKADDAFTNAQTWAARAIPGALRARAAARRTAARTRIAALRTSLETAENKLGDVLGGHGGDAGAADQERIAFRRAETALYDWVRTAEERYARALALLDLVTATSPPSDDERARIDDATITADGEAAAEKEADRDTAQAALETAQRAYDDAVLAALAANPDTDPAVDDSDVTDAQAALDATAAAYTDAMHEALQRWEATVPDAVWRALDAFLEAEDLLDELAAGPGTRAADLATNEGTYAQALDDAARALRAQAAAEREVRNRNGLAEAARRTAPARTLAALRGDA